MNQRDPDDREVPGLQEVHVVLELLMILENSDLGVLVVPVNQLVQVVHVYHVVRENLVVRLVR